MNKKFTKLLAALALLVFMTPSLVAWGQTRTTASGTMDFTQSQTSPVNNNYVTFTWTSNYIVTGASNANSNGFLGKNGTADMTITIPSGKKLVGISKVNGNNWGATNINVYTGTDNTGTLVAQISQSTNSYTISSNNTGTTYYLVTSASKNAWLKSLTIEYEDAGGSTDPTCTVDPTSWDFGSMQVGSSTQQKQFTVTAANLTSGLGFYLLEGTYYSIDVTGMSASETSKTITVTLDPTAVGAMQDMLVIEGDDFEDEITVDLTATGLCNAPATALAFTSPVNLTLSGSSVGCTLNPTASTGNGGTITYAITQGDGNHGILIDNAFEADALGTWVVTATQALNGTTCGGTADITINVYGPDQTITFNAGTGTSTLSMTAPQGSTIQLPTATPSTGCVQAGWTFAGWTDEAITETTTVPDILLAAGDDYLVSTNETLYAVYQVTEGNGGTTTFNFETIASENGWTDASQHTTVEISPVTITANGGGNNGKYYESDKTWRMYNGGSVSITASGNNITSVSSNPSTTFTVSNGSASQSFSATTKFKSIEVTYGSSTTTYNSNPSCFPMVATPTFTPAEGTYTGAQNVTINCTTEDASILYKTTEEGEWLTYSNAIPVSTTTTIWAKATKDGMDDSEIATATYTIQYTLTVDIDDVVEYFLYDYTNETWDEITIDDDGHALVFSGADVRISGGEVYDDCYEVESFNVKDGNNNPVTVVDNTEEDGTYSFIMPASNATLTVTLDEIATHYTLTVEGLDYVNFELLVGSMSSITTLDANRQASICKHSMVEIDNLTVGYGYVLESVTLTTPGNEPVELTKNAESGLYNFEMPSSNATLAFITGNASYFEAFTGELTEGDYLIVYNGKAMKNSVTSNRLDYIEVTATNDIICADNSIIWHIAPSGDYWTIYSADAEAYAAGNGTNNQAQMLADGTDNKALWAVSGNEVFEFVNKYNSDNYKNANLRNNGTYGFACYNPNNIGGALSLYKKVTPQNYTTMEIQPNQWYFIASPTGTSPTNVEALSDLYYYDEQDHYWRNQKVFANAEGFVNFDLGKGYLAANAGVSVTESVTLTFTGVAITANSYSVDLEYNANTSGNETNTLAGWNLVGNPFPSSATINKDFYVISGKNVMANTGSTVIAPCTGVMVQAEGENESVTFTKVTEGQTPQPNQLQMTVAQNATNRGTAETIDNAIVSFNEGSQLEKFIFNADLSKLYIPQNDKEYAIVSAEAQGEMPVNFRAAENGTYTLSIDTENVEMNYLHLIDNMTGMDVDLLQTPSYTFEANTRDYESRFRLVFAANEDGVSTGSTAFAFFSNGNWVINNEGIATLQVIDITGRILSSESVNGSVSTTLNATPGVYMLRLINGENVKVQKIVVR